MVRFVQHDKALCARIKQQRPDPSDSSDAASDLSLEQLTLTLPTELAGDGARSFHWPNFGAPSTFGATAPAESPRLLPRPAQSEGRREPSFSSEPKRGTRVAHNIDGDLIIVQDDVLEEPAAAAVPPPVVPSLPRMVPRPAAGRTSIREPAFAKWDDDVASARPSDEVPRAAGACAGDDEPPPTIRTWLKGNWSGVVPRHEE